MTLWLKLTRRIVFIGRLFLALPFAFLVIIVRPIWQFRFGLFFADRIGHFAFDVEYYLAERSIEKLPSRRTDIFFFKGDVCNGQIEKMVRRRLSIHNAAEFIYLTLKYLPGGFTSIVEPARITNGSRDKKGVFARTQHQLMFDSIDEDTALEMLGRVGFSKGDKFVCLVVRQSAYLKKMQPKKDWSYHDYRDSDIQKYGKACHRLVEEGYWVFRMGKVVTDEFDIGSDRVIDYANLDLKCDLLDIWLMANCTFAISTGTGLDSVADIFRRPVLYANYDVFPLMVTWANSITVPKKLTWHESGRQLTIQEYCEHNYMNSQRYRDAGIIGVEMQPEEIVAAVDEMVDRLSDHGMSNYSIELQDRLWDLFRQQKIFAKQHGRLHPLATVGSSFLQASKADLFQ